jgi:hypothetical protein
VTTFAMLALSGVFLYWVLAHYLERKDNLFLATKVHVIRSALLPILNIPRCWPTRSIGISAISRRLLGTPGCWARMAA